MFAAPRVAEVRLSPGVPCRLRLRLFEENELSRFRNSEGIPASRLQLPQGSSSTVLEGLVAHFPAIGRDRWVDRMARGVVLDAHGTSIHASTPYRAGTEIYYWREVADEPCIAGEESVLYADEHFVVADKPHGLPVMPAGRFVRETLLTRLVRRLGNPQLVPLHRIDRDTAGLVLFSAHPDSRARYHALFRERRIDKRYEALAAPLPAFGFPNVRRSRLARSEAFFRMREVEGEPNSETRIDVVAREGELWRYTLQPVTGRKHQLRVHMAALGAPILNDPVYSLVGSPRADPLQLLAKSLAFVDPIDGTHREFATCFTLTGTSGENRTLDAEVLAAVEGGTNLHEQITVAGCDIAGREA